MTLTIFCLMVFALFALQVNVLSIFVHTCPHLSIIQVYMGQLRNKCVADWPGISSGVRNWTEWVLNETNWLMNEDDSPTLCGNASGARYIVNCPDYWTTCPIVHIFRACPLGFTCLPHVGDNPNFGFTSFDNLLWSMLTTFQLITLDYWENVYNMVSNLSLTGNLGNPDNKSGQLPLTGLSGTVSGLIN